MRLEERSTTFAEPVEFVRQVFPSAVLGKQDLLDDADVDEPLEVLAMLAEALALHEGGGEPIDDEAAFLREIGLDPDEDDSPPSWLG